MVFREESFDKTVPAKARLVDLIRVHHLNVRDGHQLHTRRGDRVKARQEAPSQLSKWEALVAIAKVIAARQQVVGIEVVVDLGNHAIHAILESSGHREIGTSRASSFVIQSRIGRIVQNRDIGLRVGIPGQQRSDHSIGLTVGCNVRSDLSRIRYAACPRLCPGFALAFVVHIEERLVLRNRAAQRAAKLVVVERILLA